MIKILTLIFSLFCVCTIYASELKLKADFEKFDQKNGVPHGWYLNGYAGYQPSPKIDYSTDPDGKKVIHFGEIGGRSGFSLCHGEFFNAVTGEAVAVTAKVRGKGTGWFQLQVFSAKKWIGVSQSEKYPISAEWTEIKIVLPVVDMRSIPTDQIMFTLGALNGSELFLKDLKAELNKDFKPSASPVPALQKSAPAVAETSDKFLKLRADFKKYDVKSGVPHGWYLNGSPGLKPDPKIDYFEADGDKNGIHFSEINGKAGFLLCHGELFDAHDGDKIMIRAKVKGKGIGIFQLQVFSGKKWLSVVKAETYQIPPEWKEITLLLPVPNVSKPFPTDRVMITLGAANGSELYLKDLTTELKKENELVGTAPFPRNWTVFLPVNRDFVPEAEMLAQIPEEFAGVKGCQMLYNGNEFDLAPAFGEQKPRNCAWLFAKLTVPEAGAYTIGAGADWWMQFFINGKSVFDTLKDGNIKHPPRIKDHIFTVQLRKGENIIAVKLVTGKNNSKIAFGGPVELQAANQKFRIVSVLSEDTFEDIHLKRVGNPVIIQGNPTPGMLIMTGQGVYTANPVATLSLGKKVFCLPKIASTQYFAAGLRIQGFGRTARVDSQFCLMFQKKGTRDLCSFELDHKKNAGNVAGKIIDNGKIIKTFDFPYTILPADFLFAVNAAGKAVLSINSLADSSFRSVSAEIPFFQGLNDEEFETFGQFRSLEKSPAEIVVDNYMVGIAANDSMEMLVPVKLDILPTFDPVKAGWKLAFSDEFDGDKIDWTRWASNEDAKKNISLDGKGFLQVKTSLNAKGELSGGSLRTKKMFKYGFFEARVRFTHEPGWWSFFFLYANSVGNPMIDGMEIDIYEDYYVGNKRENKDKKNVLDHNLHCIVGGVFKSWNYPTTLPGKVDDFYTIACKWTPFEISYYLNGKLMASSANHSPHSSVTFDAVNHANGIAPLDARIGANIMGNYWAGNKDAKKMISETFMADFVRIYEYPAENDPQIKLIRETGGFSVKPGEKFTLEAEASPSGKTHAPITGAYLFDSGHIIDYKSQPPYTFTISIDDAYYKDSSYVRAGRAGIKAPIYGLHAYSILVQDARGNAADTPVVLKLPTPVKESRPYQGKPQVIPGILNPSYYDEGGNGVAYADDDKNSFSTTFRSGEGVDTSGNGAIGVIYTGEWINMTVDIRQAGKYKAILNFGTPNHGDNHVIMLLDNRKIGAFKLFPHGGDHWGIVSKAVLENLELPVGRHVLRLVFIGGFNIGKLEFERQ